MAMPRRTLRPAPQTAVDLQHIAEPLRPLAVAISTLVHDENNARLHPEENAQAIEGSLRRYGQRQVITYNPRLGNRVITGNERLRVARERLGWTHIAAIAVDEDEQSSIGYSIVDNRAAELAHWDTAALQRAMRLGEATMNEQLDAMAVRLAEQMNLTMPAMAEQMSQPRRPSRQQPANQPEPSTAGVEMPARPSSGTSTAIQRHLKIGNQEVPMTPDEERILAARLEQYRQQWGTTFGFVASLLEVSDGQSSDSESVVAETSSVQST